MEQVIDYFANTTQGTKVLQGVFSAVGVVVEKVTGIIDYFKKIIIDALTHPVESIKALGKMIMENIINRFTAFSVILDGIIHLNFKKIGDGVIQAATGITHATDKIASAFETVKKGVEDTASQMVSAYKTGYEKAGQHVDDHQQKVKKSVDEQIGYYDKLSERVKKAYEEQAKESESRSLLDGPKSAGVSGGSSDSTNPGSSGTAIKSVTLEQSKIVATKKTAIQQIEEYAKKSALKIADEGMNILANSIKQQSEAKIAALEKDKTAELTNKNLTAAQRLAIQNKYKKQEDAIKAKAFKQEQEINIAKTLMNAATAEIKLWDDPGFPVAIAMSAVLAAETAAQIAAIAKQKPPGMAKGGYFKSDGKGSVLSGYSRSDDTNAHLRSGEAVVVSEAMRDPWARNLVSAINVAFGGRDFSVPNPTRGYAIGGIFTDGGNTNRYYNQPVNDQKNLANTIAYQMVNNFPPVYVDVKDINNQQNILAQTVNRVTL